MVSNLCPDFFFISGGKGDFHVRSVMHVKMCQEKCQMHYQQTGLKKPELFLKSRHRGFSID